MNVLKYMIFMYFSCVALVMLLWAVHEILGIVMSHSILFNIF